MIKNHAAAQPERTIEPRMFELTVERLCLEFGGRQPRPQVESVLRWSLSDLAGTPVGALPELGERLARQRLSENSVAPGIDAALAVA
ncbi:hypothetical protein [Nocardia concava]|uniref:hypothetical protein n=1 Tax=Nocardia concava TaxID=257281 RepID=UPI0002D36875|nr:hypothetical protein [Nocardia concava]